MPLKQKDTNRKKHTFDNDPFSRFQEQSKEADSHANDTVTFPDDLECPCGRCYDEDFSYGGETCLAGVYWHAIIKNREGKELFRTDDWLCSPIRAAGKTYTKEVDDYSLLLDYRPEGRKEWRKVLVSRAALMATKSDSARMLLASHGIEFAALDWPKVSQYLEKLKPGRWLTEVRLTGWTDHSFKTFVLPHKTLGNDAETYFDAGKENGEYGVSGTTEEWKTRVAALAIGNDWLLFSLSLALAGPLLEPLNLKGFGAHVWGESSKGKTTILLMAASVWGEPGFLKTWRTTSNGLEIACAKRSGTLPDTR
jgi:putative DNA primase/helicase